MTLFVYLFFPSVKAGETLEKKDTYRHRLCLQRLGDKRRVVACPDSRHCCFVLLLVLLLLMVSVVVVVMIVTEGI